ncbi:restriction endonuclease [Parapedobacter sp. ISTM3]|uniref:restriction endonuclease n=1 Tax=Parapedobacter sp. ISTM3 TaxID=2800130 RepID=UPI00190475BF|nr:restriction endonuclease [Parapedobacter sp. ISTM3]MBK1439481.1 restriction endonuclease [Parapedobacter sp. ISTM3]
MRVKKYSGELVAFDVNRLKGSLSKSGAAPDVVNGVWDRMKTMVYDGMSTGELYKLAFRLLKREADSFAARYSLKRALKNLGPAGYYFEQWVARLFEHAHYQTLTSQLLVGNAVTHEVDVVAQKDDELLLVECKFRNTEDAKITVTTPMYFLSRVKDFDSREFSFFGRQLRFTAGWLVTNAYMTSDSIRFAQYYGLNLLAWDYPEDKSIKRRVDNAGLYPVTCLTTINKIEKDQLLARSCILVKDLLADKTHLETLDCGPRKKRRIIQEATELVNHYNT